MCSLTEFEDARASERRRPERMRKMVWDGGSAGKG
jgi:hypothetical protein